MTNTTQTDPSSSKTTHLVSDLVSEATGLVRTEMALARAEIGDKLDQAKIGLIGIVGGAIVMLAGLFILMEAIVIALTNLGLSPGWSATIVGLVAFLVATAMIVKGLATLDPQNLMPERTIRQVKKDQTVMKEAVQS